MTFFDAAALCALLAVATCAATKIAVGLVDDLPVVAASISLAAAVARSDERTGLVLPRRLPDDWALLRAERHPSTEQLAQGQYVFLAGDSNGSEFARTLTVYRYDRSDEQAQPLTTSTTLLSKRTGPM